MEEPQKLGKPKDVYVWLFHRIQEFTYDPNQAVAGKGCPTVELEKISSVGNTCFWKGKASHKGLEINWGVVGTNGNRKFININECFQQNPATELEQRMAKKLQGAYKLKSFDDIIKKKEKNHDKFTNTNKRTG